MGFFVPSVLAIFEAASIYLYQHCHLPIRARVNTNKNLKSSIWIASVVRLQTSVVRLTVFSRETGEGAPPTLLLLKRKEFLQRESRDKERNDFFFTELHISF